MGEGCNYSRCEACRVKCDVMRHVVVRNVANIWCDLKCGVEYMECGVMWNVM